MKKIRLSASLLAMLLLCMTALTACGSKPAETELTAETEQTEETGQTSEAEPEPASEGKKDIKFYGKIVEYSSGEPMCEKMTELLSDRYNIECLQVDWGNLDTVVRTAISSGEPCDIYQYWPQNIKPLVDSGMCLDLTDYLMANDGEWYNTFVDGALEAGKYDDRYYAVPMNANYSLVVVNQELLDEKEITIPDNWTWDEFIEVCSKLQAEDIFGMAANTDNQQGDWFFRNGLLSLSASAGKLDEMAAGSIPCTDEIFTTCFNNIENLYKEGYMYPGEGAVTLTLDEAKAAFYQGKAAIFPCVAANLKDVVADADFEVTILPWPAMGEENAVLGGYDGLFIPSNVEDPDAAVEVLKTYLSADVQKIHAEAGFSVVNNSVEISDELTKQVVALSGNVCTREFQSIDAKVQEYMTNQAIAEVVLGGGSDAALETLEKLRAGAVE